MKIHYIVYSCRNTDDAFRFIDDIKTGKDIRMCKKNEWREYYSNGTSEQIATFHPKKRLLKVYMKYVPTKYVVVIENEIG
jgi:hypothetical protein